jgi:transposase-like protein
VNINVKEVQMSSIENIIREIVREEFIKALEETQLLTKDKKGTIVNDVLSVSDIQQILGIGKRQAYDLVNGNHFPVVRLGKRILVSRRVFYRWLEEGGEVKFQ